MKYIKKLEKIPVKTDDELEKDLSYIIKAAQELGEPSLHIGEYSRVLPDMYNFIFRHKEELSELGYRVKLYKQSDEHVVELFIV